MSLRMFLALAVAAVYLPAQDAALLILHKGSSSLGFYTDDGKLLASVPVGAHPHEMVLSSDGRYVYTTDNGTMKIEQEGIGGNTVSIIDVPAVKRSERSLRANSVGRTASISIAKPETCL